MECRSNKISNNTPLELKESLTRQKHVHPKLALLVVMKEFHQGRQTLLIILWMLLSNLIIRKQLNLFISKTSIKTFSKIHLKKLSNKSREQNLSWSREEMDRRTVQHWLKGHQQKRIRWQWPRKRTISKGLEGMHMQQSLHSYDYPKIIQWRCQTTFHASIQKWWTNTPMVTAWRACLVAFQMVNMSWKSRSTRPCRIERRGPLNKSRQRRARTQQEEESHIMQQQMQMESRAWMML